MPDTRRDVGLLSPVITYTTLLYNFQIFQRLQSSQPSVNLLSGRVYHSKEQREECYAETSNYEHFTNAFSMSIKSQNAQEKNKKVCQSTTYIGINLGWSKCGFTVGLEKLFDFSMIKISYPNCFLC